MKKVIFIRYGEHENGHLNEQGKQTMISAVEKIKPFTQGQNACIIAARVDRAVESAEIISENLNLSAAKIFSELYAAEEEGINVDLNAAVKVLNSTGKNYDIIIVIASREYIETLPNHILKSLGIQKAIETHLDRGEVLVLDYNKKEVSHLK